MASITDILKDIASKIGNLVGGMGRALRPPPIPNLNDILNKLQGAVGKSTPGSTAPGAGLQAQLTGLLNQIKSGIGGGPQTPGGKAGKGSLASAFGLGRMKKGNKLDQIGRRAGKISKTADALGLGGIGDIANTVQLGARAAAGDPSAIIGLAKKGVDEVKARFTAGKEAAAATGKALRSEKFGDVGAGLSEAGEKFSKVAGLGPLAEGFFKLSKVVFQAVEGIRTWGEQLHQTNMKFAEFSGAMANVEAKTKYQEVLLNMERGDRRAGPAGRLSDSRMRLEQNLAVFEDLWARVSTGFQTTFADAFNSVLEKTGIVKLANYLLEWLRRNDKQDNRSDQELQEFLDRLAQENNWERYGMPDRFRSR